MGAGSSHNSAAAPPPPGSWNRSQNDLRALIKTGSSDGMGGVADATKSVVKKTPQDIQMVDGKPVENASIGSFIPRYNVGGAYQANQSNKAQAPVGDNVGQPGNKFYLGT